MSTTVVTSNDKLAGIGTTAFHVVLIALLFLIKCEGTGGGGGNDGLGNSGFMSMDVAGIGNEVDGWGPTEDAQAPETTPDDNPVVEETSSMTDDTPTNEAPVVNTNKPNKEQNTTKPVKTPQPVKKPDPQPSKGLKDAFGKLGGNGNTTGSGNQGTENGSIDGKGVLGGGGSQGTGGGQGGGNGTGTGTGTGPGSGPGKGGVSSDHTLSGRSMMRKPTNTENFGENATMVVNVTVNLDGKVISASVDRIKSKFTDPVFIRLAETAAKTAQFDVSKTGANQRKGTITIYFKAK